MGLFDQFPYSNIHELNLDWVLSRLKQQGVILDNLNQMIADEVKDQLDELNLSEIIINILSQYGAVINVKDPGHDLTAAKGDGVTDDTEALQAIIAYAEQNNLPLLFYNGTFMAKSLNVTDCSFIGTDAQLMKVGNTPDPLIYCTGRFTAYGLRINGNLTGQSDPEPTIQLFGASEVSLLDCEIDGGSSCIVGDISECLRIQNCSLNQYTEYAVDVEGAGFLQCNGCKTDNVASGGALRFMRIDTSNSVVADFVSTASVQIGFEFTGDFNTVSARIPNTENHVNDGGQNNSYFFFGNEEKKVLNGNKLETVSGDVTENYGDHDETSTHIHLTAEQDVNLSGADVVLNPSNPLTYKTPTAFNNFFSSVPAKDLSGTPYELLVKTERTGELGAYDPPIADITEYGAVGDGATDCTQAFKDAIATNKPVFVPAGRFLVSEPIVLGSFQLLFGVGNNNLTSASNSIIISNSPSSPVIQTTVGAQFATVKSLTVTHSGTPISGGDGVLIQPGSNHIVSDVWAYNNYNGFTLQNVSLGWFTDCKSELNLNDGVHYENTSISGALQWQTQRIYSGQNKRHGFIIAGKQNVANHVTLGAFEQVYTFSNEGYGFHILGTAGGGVNGYRINNSFFGNDILGCICVNAAGTFGGFISNTVVEAAGVTDQPGLENNPNAFGIYIIEGSGPCTIENCLVHTSANTGLTSRNEFCLVNGCQFVGNGYLAENKIGATQVMGNIIFSNCYFSGQPYCGILITSAATCLLSDCMFSSDTQEVYRALAGTENVTTDNLIKITQ